MIVRKKPIDIEALTFDEFSKEVKPKITNTGNRFPVAMIFRDHEITKQAENLYTIKTLEGQHNMTPGDVLMIGIKGEIYPCKIDIFNESYDIVG